MNDPEASIAETEKKEAVTDKKLTFPEEHEEPEKQVEDEEVVESRPSLIGKPKWHKRLKKAQRFLSDCSMGQHYHVFFHKRRYSYGSPVCGFFSLLIYIALLYYMTIKFIAVINKSEYVLVEQFKPLNLEQNNLTLYKFFDTLQLNFAVVRMDTNF
jgi:hypothetical protein